ncbi:MAG: type VII secretion-associated serine protease mycosin [Dactylosporangium sp.]|nr:type VII secretion-associated serine protease mycosin [Dactylosporangium sp.]NNJ59592.1 type VII secretion-associated serine protease mycosin [Dactylosporangium sp.]
MLTPRCRAALTGRLRVALAAGIVGSSVALVAIPGQAAAEPAEPAAAVCQNPAEPGQIISQIPWQQTWLAPERVWPLSTGAGVTVAVIDSGTDASHPQLRDRVLSGWDALGTASGGNVDCVSHGTAVASIIVARHQDGVGFRGLAPGARILPVRISEQEVTEGVQSGSTVTPDRFAQAIRWAVDNGATVLNFSVVMYTTSPALNSAVAYARSHDVVMVAAAGNNHRTDGLPDPVTYPAALPGVIGVGAIDVNSMRVSGSQTGQYVDLVAPGDAVVGATRLSGHNSWTGTSFAAPMVAAAAALVRSAEPTLTADEVSRRLLATADPARGEPGSEAYGHGVVNLYRAVTERATTAPPEDVPPLAERSPDPVAQARASHWERISGYARGGSITAGALALLVAIGALVRPYGRKRRWRPTRRIPAAPKPPELDNPEEAFYRVPGT